MGKGGRTKKSILIFLAVLGLHSVAASVPLRVLYNGTASMPIGLYVCWSAAGALKSGDIVAFLPPESVFAFDREWMPPKGVLWLKHVIGEPGDHVCNDGQIPDKDSAGRPLVKSDFCGDLPEDRYWLGSDHPHSFDSRYIGPVEKSRIIYKVVWTVEFE